MAKKRRKSARKLVIACRDCSAEVEAKRRSRIFARERDCAGRGMSGGTVQKVEYGGSGNESASAVDVPLIQNFENER